LRLPRSPGNAATGSVNDWPALPSATLPPSRRNVVRRVNEDSAGAR